MSEYLSRANRRTDRWHIRMVWMLIVAWVCISFALAFVGVLWWTTRPNSEVIALETTPLRLVHRGEVVDDLEPVFSSEGGLFIPATFLLEHLEVPVHIEEEEEITYLVWNAPGYFLEVQVGEPRAWINEEPAELLAPTLLLEGEIYVAADFVTRMTETRFAHHADTGRVTVDAPGETHVEADLRRPSPPRGTPAGALAELWGRIFGGDRSEDEHIDVRLRPTRQSPIVMQLPPGQVVRIAGAEDGWTRVQDRGVIGYVQSTSIGRQNVAGLPQSAPEKDLPEMSRWSQRQPGTPLSGERVSLVWEQVDYLTPDPDSIGTLPGVNVVSPTWFQLADGQGRLRNLADYRYVQWAHEQDIRVWALVSNSFDPDLTSEVLNSRSARRALIRNVLTYADLYDLDGLNIDFENVYYEDRDILTQFVRELTALAHREGLTVSIDVTMMSSSPTWSMCCDRRALAEVVDCVMLMAYDEHYAASPVAGSVSSLPWVESGLRRVVGEVPAEKLVLGIPF
ncbi:MAG: glycosyl hydrolase family 18 protein, partial [Bacillota bacterium]